MFISLWQTLCYTLYLIVFWFFAGCFIRVIWYIAAGAYKSAKITRSNKPKKTKRNIEKYFIENGYKVLDYIYDDEAIAVKIKDELTGKEYTQVVYYY